MKIEVRNTTTGETKWIDEDKARSMGVNIPTAKQETPEPTTEPTSTQPVQPKGALGFLSGMLPAAKRYGQTLGGILGLKTKAQQGAEESLQKAQQLNRLLTQRAVTAAPERKERLLRASRDISGRLGRIGEERYAAARGALGVTPEEERLGRYGLAAKRGGKLAAELGAWMFPTVGPAGKGFLPTLARGTIAPGAAGALMELGREKPKPLKGALWGAGLGAGMTTGAFGINKIIGEASRNISKLMREVDLAPKVKSSEVSRKAAEFSLQAQEIAEGRAKPPGNYEAMKKWAGKVYNAADEKIKNLLPGKTYTTQNVLGDDPRGYTWFLGSGFMVSDNLYDMGKFNKGDRVMKILEDFVDEGKFRGEDLYFLKKQADEVANNIQRAAARRGENVTRVTTGSMARVARLGNIAREFLRNAPEAPPEMSDLLRTQHFSTIVKNSADDAAKGLRRYLAPTWWQLSAILGPALGYSTVGGVGGALLGGSPWAASIALKNPKIQNKLYELSNKLLERQAPTEIGTTLRKFLTGQAIR